MKMTPVSWMLLTVALLLLAGESSAVDQNRLARLVQQVWEKYKGKHMFSMAVSIPEKKNVDQDYDTDIFSTENGDKVKTTIQNGDVYTEGRIVAAEFQRKKGKTGEDVHAEYRVLQNFGALFNKNVDFKHDLLLFYVLGSPCYHQCTNMDDPRSIIKDLDQIKKWKHYAFVFTHVFKSKNPAKSTTEEQLREALENLGIKSGLGLQNIFRCKMSDNTMECSSCSQNNQVSQYCLSDEDDRSQKQPSTSLMQQGRSESPSKQGSTAGRSSGVSSNIRAGGVRPGGTRAGEVSSGGTRAGDVRPGGTRAGEVSSGGTRAREVRPGGTSGSRTGGSSLQTGLGNPDRDTSRNLERCRRWCDNICRRLRMCTGG